MVKLSSLASLLSIPFVVVLMVLALMGCATKAKPLQIERITITETTIVLCDDQPEACE